MPLLSVSHVRLLCHGPRFLSLVSTLLNHTTDKIHVIPSLSEKPPPSPTLPDLRSKPSRDVFAKPFVPAEFLTDIDEGYHSLVRPLPPTLPLALFSRLKLTNPSLFVFWVAQQILFPAGAVRAGLSEMGGAG